jgi:uncharacterized protein YqhQ
MTAAYTGAVSTAAEQKVRLGGMALRNGIFVHSLDHWAAAVRTPEGELRLASGRKPEIPERLLAVPGIRGVARVAEIGYLLPIVRRRLPEARLPLEGTSTLGALAASVVLSRVIRRTRLSPLPAELLGAGLSLAPALASLRGSQVAGYHGAEHKAIGGYEHGEAAVEASKEHERCGSHMVGPMLAATVIGNIAVSKLPAARRGPARLVAGLAAVGVATEVFGWMTRHSDSAVSRALRRPGYELQRVAATREPTGQELEVAQAALDEVLRLEGAPRLAAA